MGHGFRQLILGTVLSIAASQWLYGQVATPVTTMVSTNEAAVTNLVPPDIIVDALVIDHDFDTGWAEAKGRVVITKGDQELRAVYVRVNTKTKDAYAAGDVVLIHAGNVWRGDELTGNFGTGEWETGEWSTEPVQSSTISQEPFRIIESERAKITTNGYYDAYNTIVTTCTNEFQDCHYHVHSKKIMLKPGRELKLRGAKYYLGGMPVFYLPRWAKDLRPDWGWTIYPGHSSRLGAYLRTAYKYRLSPVFRAETHVDLMTERGVGLGQDIKWTLESGFPLFGLSKGAGYGDLETFYINDQRPVDDDEDLATSDIEEQRYRILLRNRYTLTSRDYTMLNMSYMSDTDVLEDFFDNEFRVYHTPDNYFIYGHNAEQYSISAGARVRLNDFFEGVNRLPEVAIDFMPQQIGESMYFYQGRSSIANLERVYPASNTNETDYSAYRFDTWHEVSRPKKFFGFLNVIPRIEYRGTYYSDTFATDSVTNIVTSTTTNPVTTVTTITNVQEVIRGESAEFRNVFGIGSEFSFKAFKQWGEGQDARRHVVEPYVNYTFVPEPSLLPENIYSFDDIDQIGKSHTARIGARNKLQRKEFRTTGYSPYDIIDVDLYTYYNLDTKDGEDPLTDIYMDLEWAPVGDFMIDARLRYNLVNSEINTFNVRSGYTKYGKVRTSAEWRYRVNRSSLLYGDISLFPYVQGWSPSVFARYEMEDSRLEEAGVYLRRTFDCMVVRMGARVLPGYTRGDGTEKEDEINATFELWLTAFPEYGFRDDMSEYGGTDY
ncbi:hypothetical protein BVX97_01280 [bacterium E08(2017)]|nr:hypothetical protein BVX97_01280 [bacterium E08(2017)]